MESKHIVGVVAILAAGAVGVTVLVMHPWNRNNDEWRHNRTDRQDAAEQAQQTAANVNQPIDAQVSGQVTTPAVTPAPVYVTPGAVDASGQALTVTFPTEDVVEVYRDNVWVPARIERRDHDRAFVRYDDRGGKVAEWVGPQRVRSSHDSNGRFFHRP